MKASRSGRIITIEFEDTDLDSNLDEEMQLDGACSGLVWGWARGKEWKRSMENQPGKVFEIFDEEYYRIQRDFRDRWEIYEGG